MTQVVTSDQLDPLPPAGPVAAPTEIAFVIPGDPDAQRRPRGWKSPKGFVRIHPDKKDGQFRGRAQVHMLAAMAGRAPMAGPVELTLVIVFALAQSHHRKAPVPRAWSESPKDASNVTKAIEDAANGIVWHDDRQVARLHVEKIRGAQGEPPRVEVRVRVLTGVPA